MREDFLQHLWRFQKFSTRQLVSTQGEAIQVLKVGVHNKNEGPDFLFGNVKIGAQVWVGSIEVHISSSHWYAHHHETDPNYDNVILHVVWEHDMEVYRKDETVIPTLELKNRVDRTLLSNYQRLFYGDKQWIHCEDRFGSVSNLIFHGWMDRLYLERLEQKSLLIRKLLEVKKNDWEAVLFVLLAKNFGLKLNGPSFLSIAQSIPMSVVRKCRQDALQLEALLLGQAGLLERERADLYYEQLQNVYTYQELKWRVDAIGVIAPKFFRLRPPNFPTIRLSQLAVLWTQTPGLFSQLVSRKTLKEFYELFDTAAGRYWDHHYNFEVSSSHRKKSLSKNFIHLLLINTVIPLQHCYAAFQGRDVSEEIIGLASEMKAEQNIIVKKFNQLREFDGTALESQALLQLKNEYCNKHKCLQCKVGNALLKK